MTVIHVSAGKGYDVCVAPGLLHQTGALTAQVSKAKTVAIISDDKVFPLYGKTVAESLEGAGFRVVSFVFPNGEQSKTLQTYGEILNFLAQNRLSRTDLIAALGGGVVGDMAGFAAATYLRGIDFIQIPTTLLAAVDSSVGGKTAVDLPAGKNLVGAFAQPRLVLCDPDTFQTLDPAVFRDGCAEVIKYGLMTDAAFFYSLAETHVKDQIEPVIAACVRMKRDLVEQDEFDTGARRLLNLGHSIGHAVEASSDFAITHGSAVAIGMAAITRAAVKRNICTPDVLTSVLAILEQYKLPTELPYSAQTLLQAAAADKKIAGGRIHLILPEAVGRCRVEPVPVEQLEGWLRDGGAL